MFDCVQNYFLFVLPYFFRLNKNGRNESMQNGFNLKEWEAASKRFFNNKKNMEAKISIAIKDGKFLIQVVDMKQEYLKYKEELQRLALKVAQGGYIVTFNSLCKPDYPLPEDYDKEVAVGQACMLENISMYLHTLFDKGLESFYCLLVTQRQLFECSYQIRHMKYDGEKWVTGKGEYLKDGSWVSPDGNNFYCNMAASVFEAIIH